MSTTWNDAAARDMLFGSQQRTPTTTRRDRISDGQQIELLERQNDMQAEALAERVSTLRQILVNVYDEVESQNRILETSHGTFHQFESAIGGARRQLGRLATTTRGSYRHICRLSLLIIIGFFLIYFYFQHIHQTN